MRVCFITEDLHPGPKGLIPGGCAYYRSLLPSGMIPGSMFGKPAWAADRGFGVLQGGRAFFGWDTVNMKLMMQRWVPEQMRQAKALGQRLIVDIDDLTDELHDDNKAKRILDPARNKIANLHHHRAVIEEADTLTVSTPYLLDYYSEIHPDVRMVRNGISTRQFEKHHHDSLKPILGWVGSTEYRSGDLEILRPWLGEFMQEHDLFFIHAGHVDGAPRFSDLAGVPGDRVLRMPMTAITTYHLLFQMDIGIVPLSDHPFNRAKSAIKGMEYAASNIPFIASDLPEYRWLLEEGCVGRIAHEPESWIAHLESLLRFDLRKREAAEQRTHVLKYQSVDTKGRTWRDIMSDPAECSVPTHNVEYRVI